MKYGFAHRGGAHGPDNTLATFAEALGRGARGLETDAWLSLDGAVILDHDGLAEVAGSRSRQAIAEVRRDQLPAHMPTLDELYEQCGTDFALAIDIKARPVAEAIVDVARRYGAAERLWLVEPALSTLAEVDIAGAHRAVTVRGNVLRSRQRRATISHAKAARVEAINARWMWWTPAIVTEVHAAGMLAFGYDAQTRRALERSSRIGLDGVFSDHVDRMLAVVKG